ncbi:MAG TPA: urate hydroxylase PuuD [Gammaproteobacteria bacterium]|nr:urate hydroxylase PuuD [Gammaproteobacteria bacterium]
MNPLNSVRGVIIGGIVLAVVIALVNGIQWNQPSFIVWIHVMAGITWIGLLYYFNFVQVPALAEAASDEGGPGGAGITKYVAPRALWWFRWGSVVTWLSGAGYLLELGRLHHAFTLGLLQGGGPADAFIGVGAWLGTIMLLNVWALIWPNQKKILGIVEASADEIARARKVAFIASRTNTLLSIPMLMSMVGYGHGGFFI